MADAVVTSKCCFSSFCNRCIRAHIVANSKCVCGSQARADDLIPNPALRTTISNILAARASSGTTEKQRSSVDSNAAAEPTSQKQSPAASEHSHVSSKMGAASEHSDGSDSTSAPAAAHEPRKKERETTDTAGARAANHAGHQYGCYYVPPFAPACYDPAFFGGVPWSADPSMYYGYIGMPYAYGGGGYPMGPQHVDAMGNMTASYGYHGERLGGRKRTGCDDC
ncbi:hypothetical protein ACQ4PT_059010 [Festuca glaucescens]